MLDEERNVVTPFTEGRKDNRKPPKLIIEFPREFAVLNSGVEVPMSGSKDSNIRSNFPMIPNPLKLLLL
jgi:hypothetical protein